MVNTQRMLCANQQALAQVWPFLDERPPVIVDWLPWSHTFGGNHNFNLVLRNGGTLYVDGGKPAPGLIETTVANLREVSPDALLQRAARLRHAAAVPRAATRELRERFFARPRRSSSTPPPRCRRRCGSGWRRCRVAGAPARRVPHVSAWGSTETAPRATAVHFPIERAGVIGLPGAGHASSSWRRSSDKLEMRVRGPNVTPGYWRAPRADAPRPSTRRASTAPATRPPRRSGDPSAGVVFDGRLAENFKLDDRHLGARRRAARRA